MRVGNRIKKAVENARELASYIKSTGLSDKWETFTRTRFNQIAFIINKKVTQLIIEDPDILESGLIIGLIKLEEMLRKEGFQSAFELTRYLSKRTNYRPMNWISGKTLQSYWQGAEAKNMKLHVLMLFLDIDHRNWDEWLNEAVPGPSSLPDKFSAGTMFTQKSGLAVIRKYYLGQYYLYYQKTDNSKTIIKTPFIIREGSSGNISVQSVSEGHRYLGKVLGIRDGCLYITCQNLDFEEIEQYIFNIGLETKPEILFGVSNTVSVKSRLAVALKNVLVKQKTVNTQFEKEAETEISFLKSYSSETEESLVVEYLKRSSGNVIITANCCSLDDLRTAL